MSKLQDEFKPGDLVYGAHKAINNAFYHIRANTGDRLPIVVTDYLNILQPGYNKLLKGEMPSSSLYDIDHNFFILLFELMDRTIKHKETLPITKSNFARTRFHALRIVNKKLNDTAILSLDKLCIVANLLSGKKIHFVIDGIDFKKTFGKFNKKTLKSHFTDSELLFLYRNWELISEKFPNQIVFWKTNQKGEYETCEPVWTENFEHEYNPAGTGLAWYQDILNSSKDDLIKSGKEKLQQNKIDSDIAEKKEQEEKDRYEARVDQYTSYFAAISGYIEEKIKSASDEDTKSRYKEIYNNINKIYNNANYILGKKLQECEKNWREYLLRPNFNALLEDVNVAFDKLQQSYRQFKQVSVLVGNRSKDKMKLFFFGDVTAPNHSEDRMKATESTKEAMKRDAEFRKKWSTS